jgi:hypothetical protein
MESISDPLTLFYELENGKRHYRLQPLTQLRSRTQFELTITLNATPALLPSTWHRFQLTPSDIQRLQHKCDANLFYQHMVFYLLQHRTPIEKLLDVSRDNRSIFSFRCGNYKQLFNQFMTLYINHMVKHEPAWPYTDPKIHTQSTLHSPPIPTYEPLTCITIPEVPLPSPFRRTIIPEPIQPCMIPFPHRNETIPFYPMYTEKDKTIMIRLHEPNEFHDSAKKCIVNMPCYIYYESTNQLFVLGYESFFLPNASKRG